MPDGAEKAKALTALEYAADQGHLAAQWKVGRMYAAGDGVPRDDQRAFVYFSQIANTHPDEPPGTTQARIVANAFVALGRYYLTGIPNSTVMQDTARAREMFAYAASYFGDADAQYQLGRLYLDGTPSDPHQAARWFQLAATKGDCRAEAVLGDMLFQGQQVPRQAARGLMWLTLGKRLRWRRGKLDQAALRQRLPSRERRRAGHGAGLSRRLAEGPQGLSRTTAKRIPFACAGDRSKCIGRAKAAPVLAEHADRRIDFAHHDRDAVAHVARIDLDDVGAHVAPGGKAGAVVEDPAVARMGRVPGCFARPLRQGIFAIMDRQVAVAIDRGAENHARVAREQRFLNGRQHVLKRRQKPRAILHRVGALDLECNRCRTDPPV